jgi:hypothetical protein
LLYYKSRQRGALYKSNNTLFPTKIIHNIRTWMNICFSFIFVILTLVGIAPCAYLEEREISEKKSLLLNMDGDPLSLIGKPYSFSC